MKKIIIEPNLSEVQTDLLIVGVPEHPENINGWHQISEVFSEKVMDWVKSGDIPTKEKEFVIFPALSESSFQRVLFVGLGVQKRLTSEAVRTIFSHVGKQLCKRKERSIAIWTVPFTNEKLTCENVALLAAEGMGLGSYRFDHFKTGSNEIDTEIETITLISEADPTVLRAAFEEGRTYAVATNQARHLVNLPPNLLTATHLASYAEELAMKYQFGIEVLGKEEMEELGMGAILAVNQGSKEEPKMIVLSYKAAEEQEDILALVGKGVTYDTGGYSLKPKDGMVGMKGDMGGAAAVLGAMMIVGERRPAKNVIAVIGATDNMISGNAFKPDDIITSLSGKTIEVLNTDAEGRLVLADAVTYAKQHGATQIIDVATLTGGVIVALGMDKTGALTNNEPFFESFLEAASETNEFVWRLPLTDSDRERIRKSDVADLNNSPGRDGHMIFAGGFIGEFVEDTPWIHLDIAGTSYASSEHTLGPKGATGVMVRTIARFIEQV